jgi:hypothetical protein
MPEDEFSWDDPLHSYAATWRRVVGSPREFFAVDRTGHGLQAPIGFLLVTLALGGLGLTVFGWGFVALPRFLIGGFLRVVLGAAIFWLIASQVLGGKGDYESTLRVLAYASAVSVLIFLPGVRLLAGLYGLFLVIVGLESAHRFDPARAVLTVLLSMISIFVVVHALRIDHLLRPLHQAWIGPHYR